MGIAKGLLVSFGEKKTHRILEKYSDQLKIFTKVNFFDVIDWNTPGISSKEHAYLAKTHFDFVITHPDEPFAPLFAIEFDGIGINSASIDPYRQLKKKTKSKICAAQKFPVLWLEFEHIQEIRGETMLDFIIECYLGGRWVDDLKREGVISPDDAYASRFRPTARLWAQYAALPISTSIVNIESQDDSVEVTVSIQFPVNDKTYKIQRSARVRNMHLPHFGSVILAET